MFFKRWKAHTTPSCLPFGVSTNLASCVYLYVKRSRVRDLALYLAFTFLLIFDCYILA